MRFVVALGAYALEALVGWESITKARGSVFPIDIQDRRVQVLATFNPAHVRGAFIRRFLHPLTVAMNERVPQIPVGAMRGDDRVYPLADVGRVLRFLRFLQRFIKDWWITLTGALIGGLVSVFAPNATAWMLWLFPIVGIPSMIFLMRAWRRVLRIEGMLLDIVVKAFLSRHMPIWHAWAELSGFEIVICLEDKDGEIIAPKRARKGRDRDA